MKNLQGQLESLKENINFEYSNFRENKFPVNFAQREIDRWEDEEGKKELQDFFDGEYYLDMERFDFFEFLPQLYYYNRNMEEVLAYVLKVDERGIEIYCDETNSSFYVGLNDISSVENKIELLEQIENF